MEAPLKKIAILIFLFFVCLPLRAASAQATGRSEFCAAIDVIFADWQVADWSDAAYTRGELPTDLRMQAFVYLTDPTLPDDQVKALMFEYSASRSELWLIAYASMTVSADGGMHDLCAVRKFALADG